MKAGIISVVFFLTLFTNAAFSQKLSVGIKAGADLHKITGKSFDEEFKLGYNAGAFVEFKVKKIGIQPEVYFSQGNAETKKDITGPTFDEIKKVKLNYMNIPILLNLYFTPNVALQLGPQFSILMNSNEDLIQNGQDAFKKGNFSLNGGLQIKISRFRIYGRYNIGLSDVNDGKDIYDQSKWQSQTIHLGLGYAIL